MAHPQIINVTNAVVGLINAAAITPEISGAPVIVATRGFLPEFELPDVKAAVITVVPSELTAELESRDAHEFHYTVDVGILRRAKDDAETGAMMLVAEQVLDVLRANPITEAGLGELLPTTLANAPIYDPESLREKRTFFSVVKVAYPAVRLMA